MKNEKKSLATYANERKELYGKIINSYRVPSKTTKGVEYTVEIDMFGNIYCDCPALKVCSHVKLVKYKYKLK